MLILDHKKFDSPGILCSIREGRSEIKHMTSGLSDIKNRTPINPQQLFHCDHITRTFTAAILMRFLDQSMLDIDAPLEQLSKENQRDRGLLNILISQYPMLKPITTRELLNNTSGLPSFDKTVAYNEIFVKKPKKIWQIENYLDVISGVNVNYIYGYDPGIRGYYKDSATNYMLASLIIETVCGAQASEQMQHLFDTFKLMNTHYLPYGVQQKNLRTQLKHGYLPISHPSASAFNTMTEITYNNSNELRAYDVTNAYTINGMGNSAVLSTTCDLINWLNNLLDCKVVINNYKELFKGTPIPKHYDSYEDFYCFGLCKSIHQKFGEIIWNAGNSLGYNVFLGYFIQKDITIALVTNISRQHFGLSTSPIVTDLLTKILTT